jgi:putative hydrolase of HD superfamily
MIQGLREVLEFMCIIDDLKTRIRTGWLNWRVDEERLESVAEHTFSALVAANCLYPLHPNRDEIRIDRVNKMLIFHEIGETVIGDVPVISSKHANKAEAEHEAWKMLLKGLPYEDEVFGLLMEFDECQTPDAKYAYHIDKIDAKKTAKRYNDRGSFHSLQQCYDDSATIRQNPVINDLMKRGVDTPIDIWFSPEFVEYGDDPFFMEVHNLLYEMNTNIKPPELKTDL